MSGGHFNYEQYHINSISDEIKQIILTNDSEEVNEYGSERGTHFSKETIGEFKTALSLMRKAYVYAQRIDWLVSSDDNEESFHSRLHEELTKLELMK